MREKRPELEKNIKKKLPFERKEAYQICTYRVEWCIIK